MTTIIFSHPWEGSFNRAILDVVIDTLRQQKRQYQLIDLVADGFNPTMTANDLAGYNRGETADPLVAKYGEMLQGTDRLIVIFPIWWGMMPAIFKGFLDKVFYHFLTASYLGDNALFKRAHCDDVGRRSAYHGLCLCTDSKYLSRVFIKCNNRGLTK